MRLPFLLIASLLGACALQPPREVVTLSVCEAAAVMVATARADQECPSDWDGCEAREEILSDLETAIAMCDERKSGVEDSN